jgi:hypothetical protein
VAPWEHRHTPIKTHVRVGDSSKQCLNEFVDGLSRLIRHRGEALLQRGIERDRGAGHKPHCAMSTPGADASDSGCVQVAAICRGLPRSGHRMLRMAQFIGGFDGLTRLLICGLPIVTADADAQ